MDYQCIRLEYRICRVLAHHAALCYGHAYGGVRNSEHDRLPVSDFTFAGKNYCRSYSGSLVLPHEQGDQSPRKVAVDTVLEYPDRIGSGIAYLYTERQVESHQS